MTNPRNLFEKIPFDLSSEALENILKTDAFQVERIVSKGHCSREGFWYDQDWNEWVLLLSGRAALVFQDDHEEVVLKPGDYLNIQAHRKHRVAWTHPDHITIWLAIHYHAVSDDQDAQ